MTNNSELGNSPESSEDSSQVPGSAREQTVGRGALRAFGAGYLEAVRSVAVVIASGYALAGVALGATDLYQKFSNIEPLFVNGLLRR